MDNEIQMNTLMVEAVMKALRRANISVYKAADDLAEILQLAGEQVEFSKKKKAPETESASRKKHQPSVVSSADGTKIIKELDKYINYCKEKDIKRTNTFIGDVSKILKAHREGSGSEYATFITSNNKMITFRLSNHNATIKNFDYKGEDEGVSIVIAFEKDNKGLNKGLKI